MQPVVALKFAQAQAGMSTGAKDRCVWTAKEEEKGSWQATATGVHGHKAVVTGYGVLSVGVAPSFQQCSGDRGFALQTLGMFTLKDPWFR